MSATVQQIKSFFAENAEKYQVLLLCSAHPPQVKPGLPALAVGVLSRAVSKHGPVDVLLQRIVDDRPSSAAYARWELDPNDPNVMNDAVGVVWLPQVRVMRKGKILLRSTIVFGEDGTLLTEDVSGMSFRRDPLDNSLQGAINRLLDIPRR